MNNLNKILNLTSTDINNLDRNTIIRRLGLASGFTPE